VFFNKSVRRKYEKIMRLLDMQKLQTNKPEINAALQLNNMLNETAKRQQKVL
jgi:hypothetical protein